MNEKDILAAWNCQIPVFYDGLPYLIIDLEINQKHQMIERIILIEQGGNFKKEIKDYRFLSLYEEDSYLNN